ncbi:Lipoyl synthase, organellar chromatophore [Streptomyces antimycoticus]
MSQALQDLYDAGCELITITQYLRPSARHHPVERWVKPEGFVELLEEAEEIGYAGVSPARSSAPRTGPAGCTSRPSSGALSARPPGRSESHSVTDRAPIDPCEQHAV